jgi:drug/metabolite transporter (DMT)-like permease
MVGVVLALSGVILAGVVLDSGWRGVRLIGPGVGFAVVASFGFAINVTGLSRLISLNGSLEALVLWRFWLTTFSCALWIVMATYRWATRKPATTNGDKATPRDYGFVVGAGVTDAAAILSLTLGLSVSYVWLVGLLSSFGPLSTALSGVVLFRERLKPVQIAGLALVGVSLVFLALG